MAKVLLICGKICAGKSTYAKKLARERSAVWLSCDDLMLSLFGEDIGALHDRYHDSAEGFLLRQAAHIAGLGLPVILDFGFWGRSERAGITDRFRRQNLDVEWHYIDTSDQALFAQMKKRNDDIAQNGAREYLTDEGLIRKCIAAFEPPDRGEVDFWAENP